MGLAKLSDSTSSTQKQPEEKRWTKKGAAIVAELLKCYSAPDVVIFHGVGEGYDIMCMSDIFSERRTFSIAVEPNQLHMNSCTWDEHDGRYFIEVTSEEGTEIYTELHPDTKIRVDWFPTEYYDAETILSLENILPADWEKAEEIKKDIKERLATAIGIPYVPGVTTWH